MKQNSAEIVVLPEAPKKPGVLSTMLSAAREKFGALLGDREKQKESDENVDVPDPLHFDIPGYNMHIVARAGKGEWHIDMQQGNKDVHITVDQQNIALWLRGFEAMQRVFAIRKEFMTNRRIEDEKKEMGPWLKHCEDKMKGFLAAIEAAANPSQPQSANTETWTNGRTDTAFFMSVQQVMEDFWGLPSKFPKLQHFEMLAGAGRKHAQTDAQREMELKHFKTLASPDLEYISSVPTKDKRRVA